MMCAVAFAAVSHIPHIRMCLFMVLGEGVYRSDAALFQGSAKVKLARDCMLHVDDHLRMVAGGHVTRITGILRWWPGFHIGSLPLAQCNNTKLC